MRTSTTTTTSVAAFVPSHYGYTRALSQIRSTTKASIPSFQFSQSSLKHLANIELPSDYSRPWTIEKTKALESAFAMGTIFSIVGETTMYNLFGTEKTFPLFAGAGAALGWYLMGGAAIAEAEKPLNGGYDAKLVADRPARLSTTLEFLNQQGATISSLSSTRSKLDIMKYINQVHDADYVKRLEEQCRQADRPQRLDPRYARTLIDETSYDAAIDCISLWMDGVDRAMVGEDPVFLLTRPPSHHACRGRGTGGCLLNSIAIAANYALSQGARTVSILDFDAHHGNGIAHCIDDNANIRYVSIHEDARANTFFTAAPVQTDSDPRSSLANDQGPLGNILNINLPPKTGWNTGYQEAVSEALEFLCCDGQPDVLLVAAGFDALAADWSSGLELEPDDFRSIGDMLQKKCGNRVAFGLEGGYAYKNNDLGKAILAFTTAWT